MSDPINNDISLPVRVLVSTKDPIALEDLLRTARDFTCEPFAKDRLSVVEALSGVLLSDPKTRRDPICAALGFWTRRSHLAELEKDFRSRTAGKMTVPAGLIFHLAPANVDTMFIYSWVLAFVTGNASVVRLTSRRTPVMESLMACLDEVFRIFPGECRGNLFVSYEHDEATTAALSASCDTRIVWGGDDTVRSIRSVALSPHASERVFASKRSFAVICIQSYLAISASERRELANRMAADIVPFTQMGCSSPHVVYWIGEESMFKEASSDFATLVETAVAGKAGEPGMAVAVRRINFAFDAIASGKAKTFSHQPHTTHLAATSASDAELVDICGGGLLTNALVPTIESVPPLVGKHHQTIGYFGLSEVERNSLASNAGRMGADRIVPIGRALEFSPYWDGYDLWTDLTRIVDVQ